MARHRKPFIVQRAAPIQLTVDRPFFYAIRDNQSGELLVIGVVTNPGSG